MVPVKLSLNSDSIDKSVAALVQQVLPMCENVIRIKDAIRVHARYEFGLVSHAFSAALKDLMQDYETVAIQLEHLLNQNMLTLHKMVYFLQPCKMSIRILDFVCEKTRDCTGGLLLDILHHLISEQGDEKSKEIHRQLLRKSCVPYFRILHLWLFRGELHDTYKEFFVKENFSVTKNSLVDDFNAQYWDEHFSIVKDEKQIPLILRPHANKILAAGKYLNVVRENILLSTSSSTSDGNLSSPEYSLFDNEDYRRRREHRHLMKMMDELSRKHPIDFQAPQSISDEEDRNNFLLNSISTTISQSVNAAHQFSSRGLLRLLEDKYSLSDHLRSLRRFFLLEHGDFFVQFMDAADEELRHDVVEVSVSRLHGLLQQSLMSSTLSIDPYKDFLSCSLAPHNLIQHLHLIQSAGISSSIPTEVSSGSLLSGTAAQGLKGIESFTLDYKVDWPLSIVLSRRAITKYQLLSRLLFFSKHVELRVLATWSDQQDTKALSVRNVMSASYALRQRMLHFLHNFVYYMCLEVISPRGHEMKQEMAVATNMDDMIRSHDKFLDTCLKECLLASQNLLKILTKLMTTCLLFADQMKRFFSSLPSRNANALNNSKSKEKLEEHRRAQSEYIVNEMAHESFRRLLNKFSSTFDIQLHEFLDLLWKDSHRYHAQLSNLCVRLDYNGFYSGKVNKAVN